MRSSALTTALFLTLGFAASVRAQDLGDTVSAPGLFSYQAPKGWVVKDTSISKYKVCMDAPKNGFAANINVVTESFSGTLAQYVESNKTALKTSPLFSNVVIVNQSAFQTGSGKQGIRLVVTDSINKLDLQQIFYFFDGTSSKIVVTASSLAAGGDQYAPIFDASLKTFQ
jgi:hypothetical protein